MTSEIQARPTTTDHTGVVRAWAPVGHVAYVLGRVDDQGDVEAPYWLDVESEVAHQHERGATVVECDQRGEAAFTGTPTDLAISQLQAEVAHLRSTVAKLTDQICAAGAVLAPKLGAGR